MNGINTQKGPSQHNGTGPYLGGPTFDPLDTEKSNGNLTDWKTWAERYEALNGGA